MKMVLSLKYAILRWDIHSNRNFETSQSTRLRVYATAKNFFTFSKIDNYDPEQGGSISFPMTKQLVFGLNVEF